jgi:hypothetical protein
MIAQFSHLLRRLSVIAVFAVGLSVVNAQSGSSDKPFDLEELEPVPGSGADETQPQFRFELIAEVSLPGPLPGGGTFLLDDAIGVEVAEGLAWVSWDGTLQLRPAGDAQPAEDDESAFAFSNDGKMRCTTLADGWIKAEKRCGSCRKVWRKKWRIRAPGSEFARPLITDKRIYYGATDNQVYGVKRGSGHRVWATDVGGRVIRPLELLQVSAPPDVRFIGPRGSRTMDLVLVVPGSGDSIIALEGRAGTRVARYELPENEAFVGSPLTHNDRVAVVRQRYDASDAALLIFELRPPEPPAPEDSFPESVASASGEDQADPSDQPDPK